MQTEQQTAPNANFAGHCGDQYGNLRLQRTASPIRETTIARSAGVGFVDLVSLIDTASAGSLFGSAANAFLPGWPIRIEDPRL